jgi:hypothetical protein
LSLLQFSGTDLAEAVLASGSIAEHLDIDERAGPGILTCRMHPVGLSIVIAVLCTGSTR